MNEQDKQKAIRGRRIIEDQKEGKNETNKILD